MSTTQNALRLIVATPHGPHGEGGIDRVTDLIIDAIDRREDLGVKAERLITRGQKNIIGQWWSLRGHWSNSVLPQRAVTLT